MKKKKKEKSDSIPLVQTPKQHTTQRSNLELKFQVFMIRIFVSTVESEH